MSARNYIEKLFGIDVSDYPIQTFYHATNINRFDNKSIDFYADVLRLYLELLEINKKNGIFNHELLSDVIETRWGQMYVSSHHLEPSSEMEKWLMSEGRFDTLAKLNKNTEEIKLALFKVYDKWISLFREKKSCVLYGLGTFGRRIIDTKETLLKERGFAWDIVGVCDKDREGISCDEYSFYEKYELADIDVDYILVSSNKYYYEISDELVKLGIDKKRIVNGSWLLE